MGATAHGLENGRVAATSAEIAVHAFDKFRVAGLGVFLKESDGGHDHARGAVAALECAFVEECLLNRVKLVAG
jgi:hypothetical protein